MALTFSHYPVSHFDDFRPVVLAADYFFGKSESPAEPDEMTLWFEWLAGAKPQIKIQTQENPPIESYRKIVKGNSSAVMFAPHFSGRPGQADVLHTEIWRAGRPITLDAGTYLYNAAPPWDNALAQTKFHNTVSVFEQNQMQKAGRFLWLDWPKVQWDNADNTHEPGCLPVMMGITGLGLFINARLNTSIRIPGGCRT